MFSTPNKHDLWILIGIWCFFMFLFVFLTWRNKRPGVGLPLIYLLDLSLVHLPGALAYAMAYYEPTDQVLLDGQSSLKNTFTGFQISLLALPGLITGWLLASRFVKDKVRQVVSVPTPLLSTGLARFLFTLSLLFFFFLLPFMVLIPSLGSLGSSGVSLSMVAVCITCWRAYQRRDYKKLLVWLIGSMICFPLVTVLIMGFINHGAAAAMVVVMFVFTFFRPRWVPAVSMAILLYLGMTLYVNYMWSRNAIRSSVWGEQQFSYRIDKIRLMLVNFKMFDPWNHNHLETVDGRLNQNHLVGRCANYMQRSTLNFAHGGTIAVAATAWIPRFLWRNKPSTAGSGGLVSLYTGMEFAKGTSVGLGEVLEFYINWGGWFVFVGFVGLGFVQRWIDLRAWRYLANNDYWSFARWFLPGLGLMMAETNTATMVAAASAAWVFMTTLHHVFFASSYAKINSGQAAITPRTPYRIAGRRA